MKRISSIVFILFLFFNIFHSHRLKADRMIPVYYYGVMPYQKGLPIEYVHALYTPMLTWLGEQSGCQFVIIVGNTYEEMINMLSEGKVQLATLGPVPYITAKDLNPEIKLLASELSWSKIKKKPVDSYSGYIIALNSRDDIKTFHDLKGKTFSFVNHKSTSGYIYPLSLLQSEGFTPEEYFGKTFFLGSHPRVTDAIKEGSIDGGATYDFNLEEAIIRYGDIFKIIAESPPIPSEAVAAHPSLPDNICDKIQEALPRIDPALLKDLHRYGYIIRKDSFYDTIRLMMKSEE